jgi:hypothetical protein
MLRWRVYAPNLRFPAPKQRDLPIFAPPWRVSASEIRIFAFHDLSANFSRDFLLPNALDACLRFKITNSCMEIEVFPHFYSAVTCFCFGNTYFCISRPSRQIFRPFFLPNAPDACLGFKIASSCLKMEAFPHFCSAVACFCFHIAYFGLETDLFAYFGSAGALRGPRRGPWTENHSERPPRGVLRLDLEAKMPTLRMHPFPGESKTPF